MASSVTINAATLEGQLLELVETVSTYQGDAAKNPSGTTVISGYNRNMASETLSVTLTIPTTDSLTPQGILIEADPIFVD